jgi:ABC-2 type transport system ATP-binding protein
MMQINPTKMLQISQLSKSFNGQKAVQNLQLQVKAGEIYGLLGPNGAGKSTTLSMIMGLVKPDTGSISLEGEEVEQNLQKTRAKIAYLPEQVALYPFLSGLENLDYFCRLSGLQYKHNELKNWLSKTGLSSDAHGKKASYYSKGMRQKVGMAIAFAKQARLLLLDEPSSGLDPTASNELTGMIKDAASQGLAVLMASHDIYRVRDLCHRAGILAEGRLLEELQVEAYTTEALDRHYLQVTNPKK